ncbi:uncharacterized protein MONBRDRAFT_22144 [Monosiga brevicollis MX1]|uniref:Uncharacterized protein n=1 Tax=Monosiga brevicollis TaxID=81824 RepID=A9UPP5_MONBE|nr:uncharacterized protein MONBRDRAFT_22144 [Monosiga brevicollis MX1]EDQ92906.1 predicted protein [Monosiga brevicollis MX1]|eukprot:XP_001742668.1 hypothetical protein [Monosiga brevicollis MX1]
MSARASVITTAAGSTASMETIWISSGPEIDVDIGTFRLWLDYHSPREGAQQRPEWRTHGHDIVLNDTVDQFQYFSSIEPWLQEPSVKHHRDIFSLRRPALQSLLTIYYSFHSEIIRDIVSRSLGKQGGL